MVRDGRRGEQEVAGCRRRGVPAGWSDGSGVTGIRCLRERDP